MQLLISEVFSFLILVFSFFPQPTFTEAVVGQPQHINPLKAGINSVDKELSRLIFRSLMKYDEHGVLKPDLAERYQISPDQKEYTLVLHKGVYWHDGIEFGADDVLYTVSQHPQLRLVQVDKLDRYSVRFRLRDPYAPFLDLLTLGIVPFHLGSNMGGLNPVGTGDYRLIRIKKSSKIDEIVLIRVGSFKSGSPRSFNKLVFKFYPGSADLLTAARLGEVDAFASEDFVEKVPNFNQYRVPLGSRYYALFINLKDTPDLKNKELRQDIASSIPKDKIVDEVFKGYAVPAYLPLEYTIASASGVKRYRYREDLPRKYDISLKLTVPKKETHLKTAEIIKESLEKVGVHLTIVPVESEKITSDIINEKNFDLLLLGQEIERDPDVYTLWHSTQKNLPGLNFISFESVLADKALEEGRKITDVDERIKHYQNFQRVFADEVPVVLIYHPIMTYSVKSSISGVSLQGLFKSEERFETFENWYYQN